jgi:hypothetical protein
MPVNYKHVEAHFDDFVSLNQLTSQKTALCHSRLNSEIALLLSLSLTSGPFIPPPLCSWDCPSRHWQSESIVIYQHQNMCTLEQTGCTRPVPWQKLVNRHNFDFIYCEGVDSVMHSFPQIFCVWIAKHAGICSTNRQLSGINPDVTNVCHCCGQEDVFTCLITCCLNVGTKECFASQPDSSSRLHDTRFDSSITWAL